MTDFIGRERELGQLRKHLDATRPNSGRLLVIRGRRQAGKSRLVSTFLQRSGLPQLFVTASRQASVAADLDRFHDDIDLNCTLPGVDLLRSSTFSNWEQALRTVHAALPPDGPAIVVIDEIPWLLQRDPGLEGTLQKLWDKLFDHSQVLFILIGSDMSMMEMLTTYARPLYGRAQEMVVSALSPRDTARMIDIDESDPQQAALAWDAYLLTGGYPRLVHHWGKARSTDDFLQQNLDPDISPWVGTGRYMVSAEFSPESHAATVAQIIGAGETTFAAIASQANLAGSSLTRALNVLLDKRVIALDQPLSLKPAPKLGRYRIDDPYLRFWLRFLVERLNDIQRGRGDIAVNQIRAGWEAYRGKAIEPVVREALWRLAVDHPVLGDAERVGGWWPRSNNPEVDLVGASLAAKPSQIPFIGSVKWRSDGKKGEGKQLRTRDLTDLLKARELIPGAGESKLVAVTRLPVAETPPGWDAVFSGADLLAAWE